MTNITINITQALREYAKRFMWGQISGWTEVMIEMNHTKMQ